MPNPFPQQAEAAVRTAYDAVARAYHAQLGNELDHKPLDRALLHTVMELAGQGIIADLGCGPGHITRFLAAHHKNVLGVDHSPGMIQVAKQHAPGVRFELGSLRALPAPDGA